MSSAAVLSSSVAVGDVSFARVEAAYRRAGVMQRLWRDRKIDRCRAFAVRGVNAARAGDARVLRFLEFAAEELRRRNDEDKSRFEQEGFVRQDFTEFSMWRAAYLKAVDLKRDPSCDWEVFGWIYGAVAEEVLGLSRM